LALAAAAGPAALPPTTTIFSFLLIKTP